MPILLNDAALVLAVLWYQPSISAPILKLCGTCGLAF